MHGSFLRPNGGGGSISRHRAVTAPAVLGSLTGDCVRPRDRCKTKCPTDAIAPSAAHPALDRVATHARPPPSPSGGLVAVRLQHRDGRPLGAARPGAPHGAAAARLSPPGRHAPDPARPGADASRAGSAPRVPRGSPGVGGLVLDGAGPA